MRQARILTLVAVLIAAPSVATAGGPKGKTGASKSKGKGKAKGKAKAKDKGKAKTGPVMPDFGAGGTAPATTGTGGTTGTGAGAGSGAAVTGAAGGTTNAAGGTTSPTVTTGDVTPGGAATTTGPDTGLDDTGLDDTGLGDSGGGPAVTTGAPAVTGGATVEATTAPAVPDPSAGEVAAVTATVEPVAANDASLRFTLSSFLYRETGDPGPVLQMDGTPAQNASPVRRFFGDLRTELSIDRIAGGDATLDLDGRVRQTTSQRFQSGASGGSEYELRTLAFRKAFGRTEFRLGRQFVEPIGATKIDGLVASRRLTTAWSATLFGGAYPVRGSRSVGTDYPRIRQDDGTLGSRLIPFAGGAGVSYRTPALHGDIGLGAIRGFQTVPGVSAAARNRVFTSTAAYWRPSRFVNLYHYGIVDVAGGDGVHLTNASLGLDVYPAAPLQVSLAVHHVDTELFEIAATSLLEDPDPTTLGVVQNGIALYHVSQDLARGAISVALARARFEITLSGSLHRRPAVDVALVDGTTVTFAEASMVDATLSILDRRSFAGLRIIGSGSLLRPLGDSSPNRSRGVVARLAVSRPFAKNRGEILGDLMIQRVNDLGPRMGCTTLDNLACFGTSSTTAVQAGALTTIRASTAWLVLFDGHVGFRRSASVDTATQEVTWPTVLSWAAFLRLQWRFD